MTTSPSEPGAAASRQLLAIAVPSSPRAPFVVRRVVGSLISGPPLRAIDAALLASEVATCLLDHTDTLALEISEAGRVLRVSVAWPAGAEPPDEMAVGLLDKLARTWELDGDRLRFEIELIRRRRLPELSDEALFELMPRDRDARDELFDRYSGLAHSIARRFATGRPDSEDLEQAALFALVNAVERYEPRRGTPFEAYAGKVIAGTLKNHLRDTTWQTRVPRRLKERAVAVTHATPELTQRLGREPSIGEIAEELGISESDVEEARLAGAGYSAASLNAPGDTLEAPGGLLADGEVDEALEIAGYWHAVESAFEQLPPRERRIVFLRFFEDLTQREIADAVGISQVHVSRLLSRSIEKLRTTLGSGIESGDAG